MKTFRTIARILNPQNISLFGFRHFFVICHLSFVIFFMLSLPGAHAAAPLHALLITGGRCHDYAAQKKILTEGTSARANVTWTIIDEGERSAKAVNYSI